MTTHRQMSSTITFLSEKLTQISLHKINLKDMNPLPRTLPPVRSRRCYLLVDSAVGGAVVEQDAHDVDVSSPGGEVQREAAFTVGDVGGGLELQQPEHHFPESQRSTAIDKSNQRKTAAGLTIRRQIYIALYTHSRENNFPVFAAAEK